MTKTTNTYSLSTINLYYNNFFDVPTPSVTHVATKGWEADHWKDYGGIGTTACFGLVTCVGCVFQQPVFQVKQIILP